MEEERVERKLVAILAGDVVGYSRLMGRDEEGTVRRLKQHRRQIVDPRIANHHGRIVKVTGDGILIEFASVVDAVRCAVDIQDAMGAANTEIPDDMRIEFRIGINVGDVIIDGDDIHGDGVNVAARLEALATPGGICVSRIVRDQIRDRLLFGFEDMGEQSVKNIARPIRVFRIRSGAMGVVTPPAAVIAVPTPAQRSLAVPDKPSIAVLPFQNMSGDAEQEFFADGMVEDIITGLSRIRGFFVIARNSSFAYKGRSVDIKQVGRELGVRYVLEGSVRKAGNRVRITAQLVDADTSDHIWAERYDRDLTDIFAVQDEITTGVVAIIEPKLYAAERQRLERKPPGSLDAWGSVIRALWHLGRLEPVETVAAEAMLQQAIELDPSYARAHAMLAWCLGSRIFFGQLAWDAGMPRASAAALASLSLDSEDHWSHFASGNVQLVGRKPAEAAAALRQSLSINPSFALGYTFLGAALIFGDRPQEGLEALDQGTRMSPLDPFNAVALTWRSNAQFYLGDLAAAEIAARAALRQRPNFPIALRALASCLAEAGRLEEARRTLADSFRVEGLQMTPGFASVFRERLPHTNADHLERYIGALMKAGLQ